jgi:two-component system phosphate regulon response regulator PhoB
MTDTFNKPADTKRSSDGKSSKLILVAEDERDLAETVCFHLEREGYKCRHAIDGQAAINEIQRQAPDLIILDRMMPRVSGDELINRIRKDPRTASIPIIMLTAKAEESDELVGFALGADDYVSKPFSTKLLMARVASVLRRNEAGAATGDVLSGGPIVLDRARHEITVADEPINLTATEFRILAELMAARGRVLNRDRLIDTVLGVGVAVTHRTIDVHIAALRKKLGASNGWVQTIRGVGYTFRPPQD